MITPYLLASIADVRIALPMSSVEEIVRAVALTPLPSAPPIIEGAVNLRGVLLPVIDLRARLKLPSRPIDPADYLIVLRLPGRRAVVRVDDADEVVEIEDAVIATPSSLTPALAGLDALAGVAPRPDGALVIYDPSAFLSQAELDATDAVLSPTS